jgi:hypothetical protein
MKRHFAILLLATTVIVWSATVAAAALKGEVLEIKDVESYTYLRLKTSNGEVWSAVPTTQVKKGAIVTIQNAQLMNNFESKTLKKTFENIYFGSLTPASGTNAVQTLGAPSNAAKTNFLSDMKVAKASGAQARTVAEIISKSADLKNKTVLLNARVVKYNEAIMGKNWLHLRDGSGSETDATHDILATTTESTKVGDVVLLKGTVRKDKDFGSGYTYKVLIEDAKLQKN